jgi:hypothetical protein
MLIRANKNFSFKNSIWVKKDAEYHADLESFEKVISKNVTEIYTIFTFTHVRPTGYS